MGCLSFCIFIIYPIARFVNRLFQKRLDFIYIGIVRYVQYTGKKSKLFRPCVTQALRANTVRPYICKDVIYEFGASRAPSRTSSKVAFWEPCKIIKK